MSFLATGEIESILAAKITTRENYGSARATLEELCVSRSPPGLSPTYSSGLKEGLEQGSGRVAQVRFSCGTHTYGLSLATGN